MSNSFRHVLGFFQMFRLYDCRLKALAIIAMLLHMTDRRTEKSISVALRNSKESYFTIKLYKFLNYYFHYIASGSATGKVPRSFNVFFIADDTLPVSGRRHERFHDTRHSNFLYSVAQFVITLCVAVTSGFQSEFFGCKIANSLSVHRKVHSSCARHHLYSFTFEIIQAFGAYRLYFGYYYIGTMTVNGSVKCVSVEHVKDFKLISHLHCGSMLVRVASYYVLSQTFCGYHKFFAELARAQQHYFLHILTIVVS